MNKKVRHILGISGGKDSTALAVYMKNNYPEIDIEYYFCDTGKELPETYVLIKNLQSYLGKKIIILTGNEGDKNPFDQFIESYGNFLPSSNARWCTQKMKIEPFEKFVGDLPTISYVGIRGDEFREGYVSTKPNILSVFPFRKNIWSKDVIAKVFSKQNEINIINLYKSLLLDNNNLEYALELISRPLKLVYNLDRKVNSLLSLDTKIFNEVVFQFLKTTDYPISYLNEYPLTRNDKNVDLEGVINLLNNSNLGLPGYYKKLDYKVNGEIGKYNRSRSGCFFCFYQQKIEWIWLYENHRDLFDQAKLYEKEGYTWMQDESLEDISKPDRIEKIKKDHLNKMKNKITKSPYLIDTLNDSEDEGCSICFT